MDIEICIKMEGCLLSLYKRNKFFGFELYDTVGKEYLFCDEFTTYINDENFINPLCNSMV